MAIARARPPHERRMQIPELGLDFALDRFERYTAYNDPDVTFLVTLDMDDDGSQNAIAGRPQTSRRVRMLEGVCRDMLDHISELQAKLANRGGEA